MKLTLLLFLLPLIANSQLATNLNFTITVINYCDSVTTITLQEKEYVLKGKITNIEYSNFLSKDEFTDIKIPNLAPLYLIPYCSDTLTIHCNPTTHIIPNGPDDVYYNNIVENNRAFSAKKRILIQKIFSNTIDSTTKVNLEADYDSITKLGDNFELEQLSLFRHPLVSLYFMDQAVSEKYYAKRDLETIYNQVYNHDYGNDRLAAIKMKIIDVMKNKHYQNGDTIYALDQPNIKISNNKTLICFFDKNCGFSQEATKLMVNNIDSFIAQSIEIIVFVPEEDLQYFKETLGDNIKCFGVRDYANSILYVNFWVSGTPRMIMIENNIITDDNYSLKF